MWLSVFPAPLIEQAVLSPLYILAPFAKSFLATQFKVVSFLQFQFALLYFLQIAYKF